MRFERRHRKDISRAEIVRLYKKKNWSAQQIADKYGVHYTTILRWLETVGVSRRQAHQRPPKVDPALLSRLYHKKKYTLEDIAEKFGVSALTVWHWFERFEIPRRPRGHWSKREQIL